MFSEENLFSYAEVQLTTFFKFAFLKVDKKIKIFLNILSINILLMQIKWCTCTDIGRVCVLNWIPV